MDPTLFEPNEPSTFFGLGSPKLEILLPISPKQCIRLLKGGYDGYQQAEDEFVLLVQGLTASAASELIVLNQKFTNADWF